jgi:hypothetical protein
MEERTSLQSQRDPSLRRARRMRCAQLVLVRNAHVAGETRPSPEGDSV